jgi:hypothetical protein
LKLKVIPAEGLRAVCLKACMPSYEQCMEVELGTHHKIHQMQLSEEFGIDH